MKVGSKVDFLTKFNFHKEINPFVKYWTDDMSQTSNTILSNGDLDPWGPGGVMKDIRPDLPAPIVHGGAHHLDLRGSNKGDPDSVKKVRDFHEKTIMQWITDYHH